MSRRCRWFLSLAALLVLMLGCRNQPDLKPAKQPEVFNPPSNSGGLAYYPKQAFDNPNDPAKRQGLDPGRAGMPSSTMPASFGGPGMGGMGGMGGPGGMGVR